MTTAPHTEHINAIASQPVATRSRRRIPFVNSRTRPLHLSKLCQQWSDLADAGIAPLKYLPSLANGFESVSAPIATGLDEVIRVVELGRPMSEGLSHHENVFGEEMVVCLAVGEETGKVPEQLRTLSEYFLERHETNHSIKQVLLMPAFIMAAASFAFYVVLYHLLPSLEQVFELIGDEFIPWPTRLVVALSALARSDLGVVFFFGVPVVAGILILIASRFDGAKRVAAKYVLKIPVLGTLIHQSALSRVFHSLALLYSAAISGADAIRRAARSSPNIWIREQLLTSIDPILEGRAISTCLDETGILPPLAVTMLGAAEETGFYEDFFRRLSKMYQEEVRYTRQQLQDMIDPASKFIFGAVALFLCLAIYWPLFNMIGAMANNP